MNVTALVIAVAVGILTSVAVYVLAVRDDARAILMAQPGRPAMIIVGLVILILGVLIPAGIGGIAGSSFVTVGVVLIVVGLVLNLAPGPWSSGSSGQRRRYF